jgi:hypothetical protein
MTSQPSATPSELAAQLDELREGLDSGDAAHDPAVELLDANAAMQLTYGVNFDEAYTRWMTLKEHLVPWHESMDCWVQYVLSDSWRHGDCHRHSIACGDGGNCNALALLAIDAVHYWQRKQAALSVREGEKK